jgi:type IV pilus assembly protein PilC
MAKFAWEGVNRAGETRKGTMEAADNDEVAGRLRDQDIQPRKIKKSTREINFQLTTGVKKRDILVFTRQLATMVDAGLPLVQCLEILATQTENKHFAKVLQSVKASVESGSTFSDALRKHPRVFDELYVNLIAAGEVGGILDTILNRLAAYIEKAEKLKRMVRSAMIYPIAILLVAIGVVVVMLTKVIPVFENMYKEFKGAKLPAPTKAVIDMSHGLIDNWYFFAGGAFLIVFLIILGLRTDRGREVFDRVILRVPVIGGTLRKIIIARFTRTLGTLLASGVPILDSLSICAKTAGNKVVARGVMFAREKIAEGKDMAGPLGETRVFPPMVVQMIGVGEQTGAMDQMLQKIADFYEDEVDVAVAALTALMEPAMMVILGGVIGGLIVAMYLPVFELAGNINAGH